VMQIQQHFLGEAPEGRHTKRSPQISTNTTNALRDSCPRRLQRFIGSGMAP